MSDFATTNDLISRWRALTNDEIAMATVLITDVSDALRVYAIDRGYDLDAMVHDNDSRARLVTAVVCDIVKREMCANDDNPAMQQYAQSVNGYNVQGTFLSPGGGLFIKNSELKLIGLLRQKAKAVEIYDY